jgi:hypothetical protein
MAENLLQHAEHYFRLIAAALLRGSDMSHAYLIEIEQDTVGVNRPRGGGLQSTAVHKRKNDGR